MNKKTTTNLHILERSGPHVCLINETKILESNCYKLYNLLFVVLLQMVAAVEEPMPGHYPFLLDQTLEAVQTPAVRITHQLHQTGSDTTQIPILFLCTHTNRIKKIINHVTYDLNDISFEILDLSITDNRTITGIVHPPKKSAEIFFFF